MTDERIGALTAITGANTAAGDLFVVVDVSDTTMAPTGTDKKITRDEMPFLSSDYATAIGNVDISGQYPIVFDPAGAAEANAWWRIEYLQVPKQIGLFLEAAEDASGSHVLFRYTGADTASDGTRKGFFDGYVQSDDSTAFTDVAFQSSVAVAADGTGSNRNAFLTVFSDLSSTGWLVEATDAHLQQVMVANAGQTAALLDLQASDTAHILEVTGDKKLGFYNQTPVALQTGVALSTAGIHAALVNLGLITA